MHEHHVARRADQRDDDRPAVLAFAGALCPRAEAAQALGRIAPHAIELVARDAAETTAVDGEHLMEGVPAFGGLGRMCLLGHAPKMPTCVAKWYSDYGAALSGIAPPPRTRSTVVARTDSSYGFSRTGHRVSWRNAAASGEATSPVAKISRFS